MVASAQEIKSQLLSSINQQFINVVGPIGNLLIDDAKAMWQRKQWHGRAAIRHYITFLAEQIDDVSQRQKFAKDMSQLLYEAQKQADRLKESKRG